MVVSNLKSEGRATSGLETGRPGTAATPFYGKSTGGGTDGRNKNSSQVRKEESTPSENKREQMGSDALYSLANKNPEGEA